MFLCGHNHAWSVSKPVYSGYDFNKSAAYNDYVTTKSGTTELKIVDEFQADGVQKLIEQQILLMGLIMY